MDQIPCPDGYLLDPKGPLADGHHALNQYLMRVEDAGWKLAIKEVSALRDRRLKLRIWMALLDRLVDAKRRGDSTYFGQLHDLTYSIEAWKLAPSEDDLVRLLERHGGLAEVVMPYTPMPHLMSYVEEHGLTERLAAVIREFDRCVRNGAYRVNQVRAQMLNSRLDMLAWRDEWTPVDMKRCWSERIRADFRRMEGSQRENWRRLLYSIDGDEGTRPALRWLKSTEVLLAAMPEVRERLATWFAPFEVGSKVRLSREGSFLLRSLIWVAQLLNDPQLSARCGEIAVVAFSPKANGEKVIRAAQEISGTSSPEPSTVPVVRSLDEITAQVLAKVFSSEFAGPDVPDFAGRVRVDGTVIHVRGDLDTYRVYLSSGAVFRNSDGYRVYVPAQEMRLGGMAEVVQQVLILTRDSQHAGELRSAPE